MVCCKGPSPPWQIIFCNFKDRRASFDIIINFVGCFKRLFGHTGIEPSCGLWRHCNGPDQVHQFRVVSIFRHLLSQVRHRFLLRNAVHQFRYKTTSFLIICSRASQKKFQIPKVTSSLSAFYIPFRPSVRSAFYESKAARMRINSGAQQQQREFAYLLGFL